jgi:hypothetical protein
MIRMLLASTAVATLLATGALAQDASSSAMNSSMMDSSAMSSQMSDASSMESSMMTESSTMSSSAPAEPTTATQPRTPVKILSGYTRVDTDQLASKIIGSPVYDGTAADANNLGNINDLVLDQNGNVAAVVLGVGGFLGVGEKQVAVDYTALQWTIAADNTERFVLQTTKDELTNAPDFKTVDDQPAQSSVVDSTASSAPESQAVPSSSAAM